MERLMLGLEENKLCPVAVVVHIENGIAESE
jgi:hypothetical protein